MKLAVVFDDLIQHGGAEKLLLSVMEVFPQAPLYVPLMSKEWEHALHEKNFCVCTSFMQKLPFKKKLNRFYSVLGLHILAFENFDFSQFDVVLSISARYAHGIITKPKTKHICYMNSPGRMFWDTDSYFEGEKFLTRLFSFLLQPFLSHVRNWDFIVSKRVDCFVANSPIPRRRIAKYYKRDSDIIFPPVEFPKTIIAPSLGENYFLIVTRLLPWKKVDIAIKACASEKRFLKIVGEGPAKNRLQKLVKRLGATDFIEFTGYVSEDEKWALLQNCSAFIMTQEEDFGIAPLEAMSLGKPVIAYKKGGALVYVKPHETGIFFEEQTPESLVVALQKFDNAHFSADSCKRQSQRFAKEKFQEKIRDIVNKVYYSMI